MLDLLFDAFSDVPEPDIDVEVPDYPVNDIAGVEDGVFVGDEGDLQELSEAGEIDGTDHIDSEDIVRDIGLRNEFLESIGYTSLPEGYEVHHVIPLSEGGPDDISNMVLLTEEEHAQITADHAKFYGWNK